MPDAPDTQREQSRKSVVTLFLELAHHIREWAMAELTLARVELNVLRRRLVMVAILAVVAVVVLLTSLIILAQTGVSALALYFGSEIGAGLTVGVMLLLLAGICLVVMRRLLTWQADSVLFSWLAANTDRKQA